MRKIRNQAFLKYEGKTIKSNVVEAEINDSRICQNEHIAVKIMPHNETSYAYYLTTECGDTIFDKKTNPGG